MRKSKAVTLILSCSLLAGCDPDANQFAAADNTAYTNNTYQSGYGYWHAPYRQWYPYPFNYYSPSYGYYHGGSWSAAPEESKITVSSPGVQGVDAAAHAGMERGRS